MILISHLQNFEKFCGSQKAVLTHITMTVQSAQTGGDGQSGGVRERKFLFRVSSSSNERPVNSESLIMSVLIIKRELLGTKLLKSHYQTSLQRRREERRGNLLYSFMPHKHKYTSLSPSPFVNWLHCCQVYDDATILYACVSVWSCQQVIRAT